MWDIGSPLRVWRTPGHNCSEPRSCPVGEVEVARQVRRVAAVVHCSYLAEGVEVVGGPCQDQKVVAAAVVEVSFQVKEAVAEVHQIHQGVEVGEVEEVGTEQNLGGLSYWEEVAVAVVVEGEKQRVASEVMPSISPAGFALSD